MANLTPEEMAEKLLAEGFSHSGPASPHLSDPVSDTPMVVTLDELRPYELDPRIVRNPLYDEIKASIRERGLDAPPPITRRPGANHYIIRNGGNTRLAILGELWSETRDERFFRVQCLFRPWPKRGEIVALTGHLAENELHGGLMFIERALGVEKARELYEEETGKPLSQSELARRLGADGYPVPQSHISRMQDTVRYLLPAIPNILYGGLGRHQVERLAVVRKAAEQVWETHAQGKSLNIEFKLLFQDVLASFDLQPEAFSIKRAQDELIGQMAGLLEADYNTLALEIDSIEHRQRAVTAPPQISTGTVIHAVANPVNRPTAAIADDTRLQRASPEGAVAEVHSEPGQRASESASESPANPQEDSSQQVDAHIVSPAASTGRLQAIQQMVAEHTGSAVPDFADNALRAIPVQVGGLFPITDVWYIDPGLDSADRLRIHIAQFAREIAGEYRLADCVEQTEAGIGFYCTTADLEVNLPAGHFAVLGVLGALCHHRYAGPAGLGTPDDLDLGEKISQMLLGSENASDRCVPRLTDAGLVKLFRLVRLARRLVDLESAKDGEPDH